MFHPINLGIIVKKAKYMIKYGFIKNNYVSSIVTPRFYLIKL